MDVRDQDCIVFNDEKLLTVMSGRGPGGLHCLLLCQLLAFLDFPSFAGHFVLFDQ